MENKKYELIDIGGDGKTFLLGDYKDVVAYSIGWEDDGSEEYRLGEKISKNDFYSQLITPILRINDNSNEKALEMKKYIIEYDSKRLKKEHTYQGEDAIKQLKLDIEYNVGATSLEKWKPAKCLYNYYGKQIINPDIKYIYVAIGGGSEYLCYIGEY